jgi:AcrR family transcriptional regulator
VIALAGVSRRSFYEQFTSKQECFLATYDLLARRQLAAAYADCRRASGGRLAAALDSCADFVAREPAAATLVLLEAQAAGAPAARRIRAAAGAWERLLGDSLAGSATAPTPVGAVVPALLGGLQGIMAARLREPVPAARPVLAEQLRWWALAPRTPPSAETAGHLAAFLRDAARPGAIAGAPRRLAAEPRGERERLLGAALRAAARNPVALVSAAQICDEAGLPLEAFFELFDDRDECLRAALAAAGERVLAIAVGAAEAGPGWPRALRSTLAALLSYLAANPLQARAVTVLAPCAGAECREYGRRLDGELARLLGTGFPGERETAGEALVGALWHLVRCHLADRRIRFLPVAAEHLTLLALAPALGAEGAAAALLEA